VRVIVHVSSTVGQLAQTILVEVQVQKGEAEHAQYRLHVEDWGLEGGEVGEEVSHPDAQVQRQKPDVGVCVHAQENVVYGLIDPHPVFVSGAALDLEYGVAYRKDVNLVK